MRAKDLICCLVTRLKCTERGDWSYVGDKLRICDVGGGEIQVYTFDMLDLHTLPPSFDDDHWELWKNLDKYEIAKDPSYGHTYYRKKSDCIEIKVGYCKSYIVSREKAKAICKLLE